MRRGSLMDGLFPAAGPLDAVAPWGQARLVLGRVRLRPRVAPTAAGVVVTLTAGRAEAGLDRLEKQVLVEGGCIEARYRLRASPGAPPGRWAVQWNLALTAGGGGDRYLALPDRPPLSSSGRRSDLTSLTLVDEWVGLEASLEWSPRAEIAWGPVETVSVSEAGFERIYQGTALLVTWPLGAVSSPEWELTTSLTVTAR